MDYFNSFLEYFVQEENNEIEVSKEIEVDKKMVIKKLNNFNPKEKLKKFKPGTVKSITTTKFSKIFNREFSRFLVNVYDFSQDDKTFCSVNQEGIHSLNFSNVDYNSYLNKKYILEIFNGNEYFLTSYFIKNKDDFKELKLDNKKIYFFKLTHGAGSYNVGVAQGKKLMTNLNRMSDKYPLIIQEGCENIRLNNGKKEDERLLVLIIKKKEDIKYFFYNKSVVRQCIKKFNPNELKDEIYLTNNYRNKGQCKKFIKDIEINPVKKLLESIIPLIPINKTLKHHTELLLLGFDIIFTQDGTPKVIEINNDPILCNSPENKKMHYQMFTEIYEYLINQKEFENFIKVL